MASVGLFSPYLNNRTQITQVGQYISHKASISCGVPDGSVLFIAFLVICQPDIHKCSNKRRFYLSADDTNILYADKNGKVLKTTINIELQKPYIWLTANKLTLHTRKSNFIVFHPYQKQLAYSEMQMRSFSRLGLRLWNEITCHMRGLPKKTFKKALRTSLLNIFQNEDDYIQIPVIIKKVREVD